MGIEASAVKRAGRHDLIAVVALGLLLVVLLSNRFTFDAWLSDFDILSYYLPTYAYLGERLRDFDLPAWNPYLFSGTPFAADPQSGWSYLPAMIAFAALPPIAAFKAMVAMQMAIAALSTYAFGRVIGFAPLSAFAAATVTATGPFLYWNTASTLLAEVATWLPVGLLAIELMSGHGHRWRIAGWMLGGLAVSQVIAAWLGQGAVYALLVIGSYLVYRWLPRSGTDRWTSPLLRTGIDGGVILALGLALAAAGLWPRLDGIGLTTLSEGYTGLVGVPADYPPLELDFLVHRLLTEGERARGEAVGGAVAVVLLMAIVLSRRRWHSSYFAAVFAISLVLTLSDTPLHEIFYLLPRFEDLHSHHSAHALVVIPLTASMLAGATCQSILERPGRRRLSFALFLAFALLVPAAIASSQRFRFVGWAPLLAAFAVALVVAGFVMMTSRGFKTNQSARQLSVALLVIVILVQPGLLELTGSWWGWPSDRSWQWAWEAGSNRQAAIRANASDEDPSGAGAFLQSRQDEGETFRYVSYYGNGYPGDPHKGQTFMARRLRPIVSALLVNGRPMLLGIEQIQGYNPVQLRRYAEYFTVLNGVAIDYHLLFLGAQGIESPLLAPLNLQYIVIDNRLPKSREDVVGLTGGRPPVFQSELVSVYRFPNALTRAWFVREITQVAPGQALNVLSNESFDVRNSALVEGYEGLTDGLDQSGSAALTVVDPETRLIEVNTDARAFLVISEVFDPNWRAYLNGQEVDIFPANHTLMGVALPAGVHQLELVYEPSSLKWGLRLTSVALAVVLVAAGYLVVSAARAWRHESEERSATVN